MLTSSQQALIKFLYSLALLGAAAACTPTTPAPPSPTARPVAQPLVQTVVVTAAPGITLQVVTPTSEATQVLTATSTPPPAAQTLLASRAEFAETQTALPPAPTVTPGPSRTPPPTRTPPATAVAPQCAATNQDDYVFWPWRLEVQSACIRVQGVVRDSYPSTHDGDWIIDLDVDPPYKQFLSKGNLEPYVKDDGQVFSLHGALHVEAVCEGPAAFAPAAELCLKNPVPLPKPFPQPGQRVWMEGRWVLDNPETGSGWSELHPLYRWGFIK